MTDKAKQKAEELKYYYYNLLEPFIQDKEFLDSKAIQCALICVEEIITDYKSYRVKSYLTLNQALELAEFWQRVKQHLEEM